MQEWGLEMLKDKHSQVEVLREDFLTKAWVAQWA